MKMKKLLIFVVITSFSLVFCISTVFADENSESIDPDIPDSWYEAPRKASDWGITEFNQSPLLDDKVEQGELPPVEKRLPNDPPVIEPYDEVGEYGGEAITWSDSLHTGHDAAFISNMEPAAGQPTPDGGEVVPYYVEGWEFSDDYTELTLNLREGVKWSDGHPFTADDYLFWWEQEANNEALSPISPDEWVPPLLEVTKEDKYTVTYKYDESIPRTPDFQFQNALGPDIWESPPPSHFMEQFHPDFVEEEIVEKMAKDVGLDTWDEYYERIEWDSRDYHEGHPEYEYIRPVLRPYVVIDRTETYLIMERNPYYPFVDTEGNQLPYIDRINVQLAADSEMIRAKAATGEATFSARHLQTEDIPLYMRTQENENLKTLLYMRAYGSDVTFMFNLTHPDPDLRDLFQNLKFRKAVSYSIDREEINERVYFGEGKPMQSTVLPTNQFYKEEYAEAYAEYNPEKARELLDEIGMVDQTGDGYRETPTGENFNPTLLYCMMGPVDPTPVLELSQGYFNDIGLNIDLRFVDRELRDTRWSANEGDITVWTTDYVIDLSFKSTDAARFAPFGSAAFSSPFPAWVNWYNSGGQEGMEPPEEMKQLITWSEYSAYSSDPEKRFEGGKNLVESQAENIWKIGTVGLPPQPVVISNDLKNVPETGLWGWTLRYMRKHYPVQFYLEE